VKPTLIGLTGYAGSGKSTVAHLIGGTHLAFAEPMKAICKALFNFTDGQLYGPSEEREIPSAEFTRPDGTPLTPRFALQTLGTEWGRGCDPDLWAKIGIRKAKQLLASKWTKLPVVITDVRFANEARLIREAGGEIWSVQRPSVEPKRKPAGLINRVFYRGKAHASEVAIPKNLVDRVIPNIGTFEDLKAAVDFRLEQARTQR